MEAGFAGALIIGLGLVARSIGTYGCLLGSELNVAERIFVVITYLPKATVQAAIGGAPLRRWHWQEWKQVQARSSWPSRF